MLALLATAGCASLGPSDGPPAKAPPGAGVPDAQPRPEPRSRYGNPPHYEVFGKRYYVMDESIGYTERGVASWYGKKFHGRRTSSGEPYDMYGMTAAHKSLPLPTYARVTNLRNGRSIVVRINDRGPFVDNRLIDLSYAAATRLDMVREGTTLVEVEAIDTRPLATTPASVATTTPSATPATAGPATPSPEPIEPPAPVVARADAPAPSAAPATVAEPATGDVAAAPVEATMEPTPTATVLYMQVGAFSDAENALRMQGRLLGGGLDNVVIHSDLTGEPPVYKVRVGPIASVENYDTVVARLRGLGLNDTHLTTE